MAASLEIVDKALAEISKDVNEGKKFNEAYKRAVKKHNLQHSDFQIRRYELKDIMEKVLLGEMLEVQKGVSTS